MVAAVSAIDTSGVLLFKDLRRALEKKGVEASIHFQLKVILVVNQSIWSL